MTKSKKYLYIIQLFVLGEMVNIGFKQDGFRFPDISKDPLDIGSMVEHDQKIMEAISNAADNEKHILAKELQLPPLVAPALESGETRTYGFDILTDEELVEETTEASKSDLSAALKATESELKAAIKENTKLKNELEKLKKELAALKEPEKEEKS